MRSEEVRKLIEKRKQRTGGMYHGHVLRTIATIRKAGPNSVEIFTQGRCYQFHLILKQIFPNSSAWYDGNHIITKCFHGYYDITGEVKKKNHILFVPTGKDFYWCYPDGK